MTTGGRESIQVVSNGDLDQILNFLRFSDDAISGMTLEVRNPKV